MAQEWGVEAECRAMLHGHTGVSSANLVLIMTNIEGWAKTIMKIPSTFTFDAAKIPHLMLRHLVNVKTALACLTAESFNSLEDAGITGDILYDEYKDSLKFMMENRGYFEFISEQ